MSADYPMPEEAPRWQQASPAVIEALDISHHAGPARRKNYRLAIMVRTRRVVIPACRLDLCALKKESLAHILSTR